MGLRTEVRELSAGEAERVKALRDEAFEKRMPALNIWPGLVGACISAGIVWALSQAWWLAILVFVLGAAIGIFESIMMRRQMAHLPTQYDPREATWKIRELELDATSLVTAMDDSEDYTTWAIFRVDDALVAEDLGNFVPHGEDHINVESIAYERVALKQLWPYGPPLEMNVSGAKIPYTQIDFEDFLWEVNDGIDVEDDLVVRLTMDDAPEAIRVAFQQLEKS